MACPKQFACYGHTSFINETIETIGAAVQLKLNDQCFNNLSFKRANCAITLVNLQKSISIQDESIYIQPTGLFARLLALVERSESSIEDQFDYELTQEPTSLFNNQFMRKPNKSNLAKIVTQNASSFETIPSSKVVIDGGALLHRVHWRKGMTYNGIVQQCSEYLISKYGLNAPLSLMAMTMVLLLKIMKICGDAKLLQRLSKLFRMH